MKKGKFQKQNIIGFLRDWGMEAKGKYKLIKKDGAKSKFIHTMHTVGS